MFGFVLNFFRWSTGANAPAPPAGDQVPQNAILTEDGRPIVTEDGRYIVTENSQ